MTQTFCPQCGVPSASELRYCRKCGTHLEKVRNVLEEPPDTGGALAETPKGSTMSALFASGLGWEAVRGVATLVIALPSFLFLASVLGFSTKIATVAILTTLLAFVFLGCRDLVRVFRTLRDPAALRARLGVAQPDSVDPWNGGRAFGVPSVTEHTTFRLDSAARDRDDSRK